DGLLRLDADRHGAHVEQPLPLDQGDVVVEPRAADGVEAAEPEDGGALVLLRDADAGQDDREQDEPDDGDGGTLEHGAPPRGNVSSWCSLPLPRYSPAAAESSGAGRWAGCQPAGLPDGRGRTALARGGAGG